MAETIIESLARLESTAEIVKSLMERVTKLEDEFEKYSKDSDETLKALSWADSLPDRLRKIEEIAAPIKEETDELTEDLVETAGKQKSTLDEVEKSIKEMEEYFGIRN